MELERLPTRSEVLRELVRVHPDLVAGDDPAREGSIVAVDIYMPETSQASRIGATLTRIDTTFRRATAIFESQQKQGEFYRPTSPLTSGLIVESVEIASYFGRHRPQGQTQTWASQHPWALSALFMVLSGVSSAYVFPMLPNQPVKPGSEVPSPDPETRIDIRGSDMSVIERVSPPNARGGGTRATVTIIIEDRQGRTAIQFEIVPEPDRRQR